MLIGLKHFGVRNNTEKGMGGGGELTRTNRFEVYGRDCSSEKTDIRTMLQDTLARVLHPNAARL